MVSNAKYKWHKRRTESTRAFAAFQTYLDLGPDRTKLEAYRQKYGRKQATKCPGWFSKWTTDFNWAERAEEYDAHVAAVRFRAEERAIESESERWAKRQEQRRQQAWDLAEELLAKAQLMLRMPLTTQSKEEETEVREEIDDPETGEVKTVHVIKQITTVKPVRWIMRDVVAFMDVIERLRKVALAEDTTQKIDLRIIVEKHLDDLRANGIDISDINIDEVLQLATELADEEIESRH